MTLWYLSVSASTILKKKKNCQQKCILKGTGKNSKKSLFKKKMWENVFNFQNLSVLSIYLNSGGHYFLTFMFFLWFDCIKYLFCILYTLHIFLYMVEPLGMETISVRTTLGKIKFLIVMLVGWQSPYSVARIMNAE